jgi:hypothetical protein
MLPDEYNEGHGHWLPTATCTGLGRCLWGRTSARVRSTLDPREAKQSARRIAPRISCERVFSRALGRLRARRGHGTGKGRRARRGVRLRRDARRRAQRAGEGGGRQQRSTLGDRRVRQGNQAEGQAVAGAAGAAEWSRTRHRGDGQAGMAQGLGRRAHASRLAAGVQAGVAQGSIAVMGCARNASQRRAGRGASIGWRGARHGPLASERTGGRALCGGDGPGWAGG